MSVANFDQLGGAIAFLGESVPEVCGYCGKPLSGLTTLWHCADGRNIALHPPCAIDLGARLCRDGLNAKYLGEGKPVTAGVEIGLAPLDTS